MAISIEEMGFEEDTLTLRSESTTRDAVRDIFQAAIGAHHLGRHSLVMVRKSIEI